MTMCKFIRLFKEQQKTQKVDLSPIEATKGKEQVLANLSSGLGEAGAEIEKANQLLEYSIIHISIQKNLL